MTPIAWMRNMIRLALAPVRRSLNHLLGRFNAFVASFEEVMATIGRLEEDALSLRRLESEVRSLSRK